MKRSTEEIKERFNVDVDRFSNAETGQTSTMDAALALDLFERGVAVLHPKAQSLCDIGCGGGNFSMRALRQFPAIESTLIDLSPNMLDRAQQRITDAGGHVVRRMEGDIRQITLPEKAFDLVVASAVLHHLRSKEEWRLVLTSIYRALKPGGIFWLWDLVKYDNAAMQTLQTERYARYLIDLKNEAYQKEIFAYIAAEDTPESASFILQTLLQTGFDEVDVVHKNAVFCALYAKK